MSSSDGRRRILSQDWRQNFPFFALAAFLVLVFLTGGGSRADIQSLVVLRPIAVLLCGGAILTLKREHLQGRRTLLALVAGAFLVIGLQLVPLPPTVWTELPGREFIKEIDQTAGLNEVWRPLTLVPSGTRNSLFALFIPLAVLLLGVQLRRDQLEKLAYLVLIMGLVSGALALLQLIGPPRGPLYFYRITNPGAAVGLFANRNHQAIFLAALFPLFALYAGRPAQLPEQARFRRWLALTGGAFLVPLILVTGSRAGLILSVIAVGASLYLYRPALVTGVARRRGPNVHRNWQNWALIGGGILLLVLLALLVARAEALQRIVQGDVGEDLRFQVWGPIFDLAKQNFPVGTGFGSLPAIFQVHEPATLLSANYLNHAHNDWLEIMLEAGLPGLLLVACAITAYIVALYRAVSGSQAPRTRQISLIGALVIFLFALGSVADYPLRAPSLAAVLVLAALWMTSAHAREEQVTSNPVRNH